MLLPGRCVISLQGSGGCNTDTVFDRKSLSAYGAASIAIGRSCTSSVLHVLLICIVCSYVKPRISTINGRKRVLPSFCSVKIVKVKLAFGHNSNKVYIKYIINKLTFGSWRQNTDARHKTIIWTFRPTFPSLDSLLIENWKLSRWRQAGTACRRRGPLEACILYGAKIFYRCAKASVAGHRALLRTQWYVFFYSCSFTCSLPTCKLAFFSDSNRTKTFNVL